MDIYVRRQRSGISFTLLVTFGLGFALGFSTCYVFLSRSGVPRVQDVPAPYPTNESSVETSPSDEQRTGEPEQDTAQSPTPPAPQSAEPSLGELWPGRHLFVAVKGLTLDAGAKAMLEEVKPGGVVLLGDNIETRAQTMSLVDEIKKSAGLGTDVSDLPLIAVDQEGGPVNRLKLKDAPSAAELGLTRDAEAARQTGRGYADACAARGIGVLFAPVLDVYEPGANASFEPRCFGSDPSLVSAMGLAFADGVMAGGVLPVIKHFPGHGGVKQDSHQTLAYLDKDSQNLAQTLFPFWEAVKYHDVPGIMVGHIAVPALETENPRRPASVSPILVGGILRQRWQYNGVIITDDIGMGAMAESRPPEVAAVEALFAGCDAVVFLNAHPDRIRAICAAIQDAVGHGTLTREQLDSSRKRLDAWRAWIKKPKRLKGPLPDVSPPTPPPVEAGETPRNGGIDDAHPDQPAAPTPPASAQQSEAQPTSEPEIVTFVPTTEPTTPKPASASPGAAASPGEMKHTVAAGDTISKIAALYGVKTADLLAWNGLTDRDKNLLKIGQTLIVRKQDGAALPAPSSGNDSKPATNARQPDSAQPAVEPTAGGPTAGGSPASGPTAGGSPASGPPASGPPLPSPVVGLRHRPGLTTAEPSNTAADAKKIEHKVKRGETLSHIAAKYGVSQKDIMQWNRLQDANISFDKVLIIHAPVAAGQPTAAATPASVGSESPPSPKEPVTEKPAPEPEARKHSVQANETLSAIAQKYSVTEDNLKRWNNLTDAPITPGQELVLHLDAFAPDE